MQTRTDIEALYPAHLKTVVDRYEKALAAIDKEGILIPSGHRKTAFLDDQTYPFIVNPHFKSCLPVTDVADSFILLRRGRRPTLFFNQQQDYWHKPPADPDGYWASSWNIQTIAAATDIHNLIGGTDDLVFLGEEETVADALGITAVNPPSLLAPVHFERAYKTEYEAGCIQLANIAAARGHRAAEAAFHAGLAEFDIQHAYLGAVRGRETDAPYSGIVALNENCAVLHYQHYQSVPPQRIHSMLIDAGASVHGYAADVTRSHAFEGGLFADLIERLDREQQGIIQDIRVGENYADLHQQMNYRIAVVLRDFGIVDMAPESMVESNLVWTFLPHGLGHFLGLQTHDVAGFQQTPSGQVRPAPERYPALRLTRPIEEAQVFTIEPGLYFIPMLLEQLRQQPIGRAVNWDLVARLVPFGGIRIEDNILIQAGQAVNLTREAFQVVDAASGAAASD